MLSAKENILNKIRQALTQSVPLPYPEAEGETEIFAYPQTDKAVLFAEEFAKLQGKFIFCNSETDLKTQFHELLLKMGWANIFCPDPVLQKFLASMAITPGNDLKNADVALTGCEALVARTGSIVLSAAQNNGRTASVYAPVHICIAHSDQLVWDIKDAWKNLQEKYGEQLPSFITLASGPSRTADIEKTLVTGVHGPKEVFCFLVD